MTDRIEEKRYQDAIRIKDAVNKRIDQTRRTKAFAEKLSIVEKRPPSLPLQPRQEIKPQNKSKDRREDHPEPTKEEPRKSKAKVAVQAKQPRTKPIREKKGSDQFFQFAAQFIAQKERSTPETQPTAQPMLPSPVVNELIERIYTCTASEGKTVSIRLKGNVLAGAQIDVSVSDREVKLRFQDTNPETRQLLHASKHLLQSRLAEKKLALRDFAFH